MSDDGDDFLISEETLAESEALSASIESDEACQARIKILIDACKSGVELSTCLTTFLPGSGTRFGLSVTMNRCVNFLKTKNLVLATLPTWANCKKSNKELVEIAFTGIKFANPLFEVLVTTALAGFVVKVVAEKVTVESRPHQALILEENDVGSVDTGRVVDRIALLACAVVDPELTQAFAAIVAPIAPALRPAFLDLGAIHVTMARWTNLAEQFMQRRDGYSNEFKDLVVTGHGTVLADIDPSRGVFYSTASQSMGKQFKELLTTART